MKKLIAAAMLAGALFAALPASADVIDIGGAAYIDTSDNTVWQESNGVAGLQRTAANGVAADTQLA